MLNQLKKVTTISLHRRILSSIIALVNILELSSKVGMGFADRESELADEILTNAASVSPSTSHSIVAETYCALSMSVLWMGFQLAKTQAAPRIVPGPSLLIIPAE